MDMVWEIDLHLFYGRVKKMTAGVELESTSLRLLGSLGASLSTCDFQICTGQFPILDNDRSFNPQTFIYEANSIWRWPEKFEIAVNNLEVQWNDMKWMSSWVNRVIKLSCKLWLCWFWTVSCRVTYNVRWHCTVSSGQGVHAVHQSMCHPGSGNFQYFQYLRQHFLYLW